MKVLRPNVALSVFTLALVACSATALSLRSSPPPAPSPPKAAASADPASTPLSPVAPTNALGTLSPRPAVDGVGERAVSARYAAFLAPHKDLTFPQLEAELALKPAANAPLGFDPTQSRYYGAIASKLMLTAEEQALFRANGVVSVDHAQRYSMGSAYYAIYTRDLPVLITTDSILHALHRSYDEMLKNLEVELLIPGIRKVLEGAHGSLERVTARAANAQVAASAADVDLYFAVARNLLEGEGDKPPGASLSVRTRLGNDGALRQMLTKIAANKMDDPEHRTPLYGGTRFVDYSQFRPRGHYTASPELQRYFRTLMWLGRADTGFIVAPPDRKSGLEADNRRELRDAALVSLCISQAGVAGILSGMSALIDFFVGRADNLTINELGRIMSAANMNDVGALADSAKLDQLQLAVATRGKQQIRSEVVLSEPDDGKETPAPELVQVFGQRFLLDSYVLSRVVFDSIVFQNKKVDRGLPSGLDAMAALGNDEAVRLLKPDLERYKYSANLLAARRLVESYKREEWTESLYTMWLDALRTLDDGSESPNFPRVMRGVSWQRKQLQTQLASWAELRHDTLLYGKQSYTAGALCFYPAGFVEPYPEFFDRLARFAEEGKSRVAALDLSFAADAARASAIRDNYARFLTGFAEILRYLERLARKELAAKPFTAEEEGFLKKTIDVRGGGSGPPTYSGWYTDLFFDRAPQAWKPSVADVHSDPRGSVLEEAVGDVNFIVVAIDNQANRTAYVGPVYSYYEFMRSASSRMRDEEWQSAIHKGTIPERPEWTRAFRAPARMRTLAGAESAPKDTDPRSLALEALRQRFRKTKDEDERRRLLIEMREAAQKPAQPPGPGGH